MTMSAEGYEIWIHLGVACIVLCLTIVWPKVAQWLLLSLGLK